MNAKVMQPRGHWNFTPSCIHETCISVPIKAILDVLTTLNSFDAASLWVRNASNVGFPSILAQLPLVAEICNHLLGWGRKRVLFKNGAWVVPALLPMQRTAVQEMDPPFCLRLPEVRFELSCSRGEDPTLRFPPAAGNGRCIRFESKPHLTLSASMCRRPCPCRFAEQGRVELLARMAGAIGELGSNGDNQRHSTRSYEKIRLSGPAGAVVASSSVASILSEMSFLCSTLSIRPFTNVRISPRTS